jgi:site-specific DNA-methyltransferase (adenine-specific)
MEQLLVNGIVFYHWIILWNEYKRVLKPNGVILLTASQPFTTVLIGNDLKMFKYNLVWDKVAITNPMLAKKQPMRCHEDVLVFYDKQPTYNPQMRVPCKDLYQRRRHSFR